MKGAFQGWSSFPSQISFPKTLVLVSLCDYFRMTIIFTVINLADRGGRWQEIRTKILKIYKEE